MDFDEKKKLAKKLKIDFSADTKEEDLDVLIKDAQDKKNIEEAEAKALKERQRLAALEKKSDIVLKNTDGEDVDQADYFYPRLKEELVNGKTLQPSDQTAPSYFNKVCGLPVDREDLLEVFNGIFKKDKKFLFYKARDKELYLVIVPLMYAKTVGKSNESQPGDAQKHALSFIGDGSVNIEGLKMKLTKIYNHPSISREPLA